MPKQIALRDPEAIAVKVAPAMVLMAKVSLPLVWLLDRSGKVLLWLLGHRGEAEDKVSEDEIRTLGRGSRKCRRAGARREGDDRGRDAAWRSAGRRRDDAAARGQP